MFIKLHLFKNTAPAIWGKMPLQNIANVDEVGIGKTQTLVSNIFETFLLFTVNTLYVYSKSNIAKSYSLD